MKKNEFSVKCLRRGYGTAEQIKAWIKQSGKRDAFTEADTDECARWCASVEWNNFGKHGVKKEVKGAYEIEDRDY